MLLVLCLLLVLDLVLLFSISSSSLIGLIFVHLGRLFMMMDIFLVKCIDEVDVIEILKGGNTMIGKKPSLFVNRTKSFILNGIS